MATTVRADVIGTVPTIVAKEILKYTIPNLEAWKRINTKICSGINVGDRVQIPTYADTAVTPDTGATAAVQLNTGSAAGFSGVAELNPLVATYVEQTVGSYTVYIANWFYVAMELSIYADAVAQGDMADLFKQAGLDALPVHIDTTVMNLISSITTNAAIGTLGTAAVDDNILDAIAIMDGGNVPPDDRSYLFSQSEKANYFKLDKYTSSLYRGDTKPLTKGMLGNLYGMDWAWTTQMPAPAGGQHRNILFHRDTFGGAMRRDPQAKIVDMPDPNFGQRIVSYSIWGVNVLRNRFGQQVLGV